MRITLFVSLVSILCAGITAARADLYGLAVGINDYRYYGKLEGAVDDARDIAQTLQQIGARHVTLLVDHQATKARIKRAWLDILRRTSPGDTLVFSYAGHGGQEREAVNNSEEDHLDEAFLLGGFTPRTLEGRAQRIVDNELFVWLSEAGKKGIRVIFVADSCHSGTVFRGVDKRTKATGRSLPPYGIPTQTLPPNIRTAARNEKDAELPHVTFFAAAQDHEKINELPLGGRKRGALSWAFARALEQGADRNGDNILTRLELESFIVSAVEQLSESRQKPDVRPRSAQRQSPLIKLRGVARGHQRAKVKSDNTLRIQLLDNNSTRMNKLAQSLEGVQLVSEGEHPDLIWDNQKKEVISGVGDIVAQDVGATYLQDVIDKWRALEELKALALTKSLPIKLHPDDSRHAINVRLTISTAPVNYPYITLLNLSSKGGHTLLYPLNNKERHTTMAGIPFVLDDLFVRAPFGADHIVAIASANPLASLHALLGSKTRYLRNTQMLAKIKETLSGKEYQIGIKGLYTYAGE